DYGRPFAIDIPGNTYSWREVGTVGVDESIAHRWLTLLNDSQRRIEVAIEVVDLFKRRYVGVAQAQVQRDSLGQAPIVLRESGVGNLVGGAVLLAGEEKSGGRITGEEVFERGGIGDLKSLVAPEVDPPPGGVPGNSIDL